MSGALPAASVIVPTRERPELLARCLAAIEALDYPKELVEVVVVEDTQGKGPAAARNLGIARSSGELLAFTDDDCVPAPKWLELLARTVGDRERLAGGQTVNALTSNPYSAASQAITDAVYDHYNAEPAHAAFLASNNLAGPRIAFERLGGFDERFSLAAGEDRDLCSRWLEQGGELVYVPGAIAGHTHDLGLGGFWRQHYGYGRGTYLQRKLRAERGGDFELAPAATSGILSSAARSAITDRRPSRLALLAVWQLANLAGFARQSLARSSRQI